MNGPPRLLRLDSAAGRGVVAAAVLGSGTVFLESTVVTVALPAIARDFDLGMEGLQWLLEGYLLTLTALMLVGGSLGDVRPRRSVYVAGLVGFAAASCLCALAPSAPLLVASRVAQGAAGALLVPNSLAMLEASFVEEDRGVAIGRWAGWSAVSTAAGPLVGGWLAEQASWRWAFACVVPFAAAATWLALRHAPAQAPVEARRIDLPGAVLVTAGLGGVVVAMILGPRLGFASSLVAAAGLGGLALLAAFLLVERRSGAPLLPFHIFRSRQFSGANAVTLLVYAALGSLFLFLMVQLQAVLGYGALAAGAALLPVNVLMLALSPAAGRLSQRIGPRLPIAAGALGVAAGMALLAGLGPGAGYLTAVLPGVVVFGLGLAMLVTPLTTAVLGSVSEAQTGVASAVNNAVARLANLLAIAAIPLVAGLAGVEDLSGRAFASGYERAMWVSAGLAAAGAVVALLTIDRAGPTPEGPHPSPVQACVPARRRARPAVAR